MPCIRLIVVGFNILIAETDAEANTAVPVAEWISDIRTRSEMGSQKACLLIDLYLNKNVFHQVSFEMIYRTTDSETVEKKLLFSISNDGIRDHVKDVLDFSLDVDVSSYQVWNANPQTVAHLGPHNRWLTGVATVPVLDFTR